MPRGEVPSVRFDERRPAGCSPTREAMLPATWLLDHGFRIVMNRDTSTVRRSSSGYTSVNANLIAWNLSPWRARHDGRPACCPTRRRHQRSTDARSVSVARAKMNGDEVVRDANGLPETIESTEIAPRLRASRGQSCLTRDRLWAWNVADTLPDAGVRLLRDA